MNYCYLSLGSNLKSPERQLRLALAALRQFPASYLLKKASLYRSKAWGRKTQPDFYNTVVLLQTRLSPWQLLQYCQKLEKKQGRIRSVRYGSRTLDVDILIYGDLKQANSQLTLPHPRLHCRDFVLIPLHEICSHPLLIKGKTIAEWVIVEPRPNLL